jgi:phosphohistidine phosphatase SixA
MNMTAPKTILISDRVRYESAAGTIRGVVVKIARDLNAAGDMIDWIYISHTMRGHQTVTRLADTALAMMQFKVIFRG